MMDGEASDAIETNEDIFAVALSDEALERTGAVAAAPCITLIYCTQDLSCGDV